jgi:hypothetical protein
MIERLKLRQGQEALVWASASGAVAAGVGVPALRRSPAPTTWEHHLAVGWCAAYFTVAGRGLLGARELAVDERWSGQLSWSEQAGWRTGSHRPDLITHDPEGRVQAVEVELTVKSRERTRAVLDLYARSRAIDRVAYVAGDELVARHVGRCLAKSTLAAGRVAVVLLADVRAQARAAPRRRYAVPAAVTYAVAATVEELETQQRVKRHQAAVRSGREQHEQQRRGSAAAQQPPPGRLADHDRGDDNGKLDSELVDVDARLAELTITEPPGRQRRWGRR